jgi:signal transduction histidine kinase
MKLRTKLFAGILITLLLQIIVTGGYTLVKLIIGTKNETENGLEKDWARARSYIEELKHRLTTDLYELRFFLQNGQLAGASPSHQRDWFRYFISLTDADRILLLDGDGHPLVDEWAGLAQEDSLYARIIDPRYFRFPRSELMTAQDRRGVQRLYLVTGTTQTDQDGGKRYLYLITNIDKSRADAIFEKTGASNAFFVGETMIASSTPQFSLDTTSGRRYRTIGIGDNPYEILPQTLSSEIPERVYLVTLESLLAERLNIRNILIQYITTFLVTLAASLFLAAGITSLMISPFSRLNQWLHTYMDAGIVGHLNVRSRDEVGFLAGAFHTMITTLIGEKRVISEQLEQISFLHSYNESIMNNIKAAIIVADAGGAIEFCNTYFLELTGTVWSGLEFTRFTDILGRHFRLRSGDPPSEDIPLDRDTVIDGLKLERERQEPMHFTAKICPIALSGNRRGVLIVLEDISTAEKFWEKLMIAEKVTSLGILSAGMAHEINNPLGSILSHVKYLKTVEKDREKLGSLSWIENETNRIAEIVSRIRAYSAPRNGRERSADMNATVLQTLEAVKFTLEKRRLHVSLDLEEGLPAVSCAPDELKQVVLNIVLNSCQASPEGGEVSFRSRAGEDGSVRLVIADHGAGIDPADRKNIFDPFFTTKPAGEGSGLGLSISYAIVKRARGDIRVESIPGRGTEVEVILNVHESPHR